MLFDKGSILLRHFRQVLRSLYFVMCLHLYSREAHQQCRSSMLVQDPIDVKKALCSDLVIVCVVDRDACVSLPDQQSLGDTSTLLLAHGIVTAFSTEILKFKQCQHSHGIRRQNRFRRVCFLETDLLSIECPP